MTNNNVKNEIKRMIQDLDMKHSETGYVFNEVRLICENALKLIEKEKPKPDNHLSDVVRSLRFTLELCDLFIQDGYNHETRRSKKVTHHVLVGAAKRTLEEYLRGGLLA